MKFFLLERKILSCRYVYSQKNLSQKNVKSEGHNEIFFKKNENIECKVFILQQGMVCNF